ncbi:MAG: hypothetical protein ACTHLN_06600, partial [Tepidisphaeraceae bacterium]
ANCDGATRSIRADPQDDSPALEGDAARVYFIPMCLDRASQKRYNMGETCTLGGGPRKHSNFVPDERVACRPASVVRDSEVERGT